MYNQCFLTNGNMQKTAWIPSKYAKMGDVLKLCGQDGWLVESVGVLAEHPPSRAWTKHRGNTDVPHGTFKPPVDPPIK
jgi:hypothetical protein